MKKIKRYLQQQGWYLESKSLYDGKATLLGGNLLEGKMNLKKTVVFLIVCITFFSCDKFLEESPRDKLPEDEVYNNISDVYLNAVASLYTYIGGYSDSQGLQGTGRGVYDLNTFTTDESLEIANYESDLLTYASETCLKFLDGSLELNDDTWNEFVDTCNSMGLPEIIAVYQNAYDEYQAGER